MITQLLELQNRHQVDLICVPGLEDIEAKEMTDECSVKAKVFDNYNLALRQTSTTWSIINTCRISKMLWPYRTHSL